ncbi:MAG: NAD-dependent epimerase/dehydratase family protein [Cyanobacteria bacterium P01_F01_bin.150]
MNVFLIGGTNFIGPHVVRSLLAAGHQVMVFHRGKTIAHFDQPIQVLQGDRNQLRNFQKPIQHFAPDVVVDMIAYTQTDAQTVVDTLYGLCNRVVVISSQDVYRARDILWGLEKHVPDPTPLKEDAPLRSHYYPYRNTSFPRLPEDYDKILVEQTYLTAPEIQTTILRLPMVYGPGDPLHRFAAYLYRMERQRPVILLEETLAHWCSSYGYVENVAQAIVLAVSRSLGENTIFNISDVEPLNEQERLSLVGQVCGWQGRIVTLHRDAIPEAAQLPLNFCQDWVTDSSRIRQELGYRGAVSRLEAIQRTVSWQRSHMPPNLEQSASAMALLDEAVEDTLMHTM